jgi:hypothetical protein
MNSKENSQKILFNNKYEQVRLLGEGSFGKAFLVESIEDKVNLKSKPKTKIKKTSFIILNQIKIPYIPYIKINKKNPI